ncbi:MAG TPA: phosphonate ABC transporter, permease protein PhnE [Burkholderiales bacterium]|nr:phosphonate ABC transporter, permease protein PhnE [Burkholderiales bacterium]
MAARTGSIRVAFPPSWAARAAWLVFAVYLIYAASQLELTPARFAAGLEHGAKFLGRLFPPDFTRWELLLKGMVESLQIAVLASALGVLIATPLSLLAARNLMPAWASWPARAVMVLCRTFHPVIVAILFVKAVGFGALAGILALTLASVGFLGKLMTEAIEEISLKQVEAVRATGAPFLSVVTYAVAPQVFSRFIGFVSYETDANLRNSTMVGIVGAGGIGGTLFAAFQRFDYDFVCAIVLTIIALIMAGEILTMRVKKAFRA